MSSSRDPSGGVGRIHGGCGAKGRSAGAAEGGPPPLCPGGASTKLGRVRSRQSPDVLALLPGGCYTHDSFAAVFQLPCGCMSCALPYTNAIGSLDHGVQSGPRVRGSLKPCFGWYAGICISGQLVRSAAGQFLESHTYQRSLSSRKPPAPGRSPMLLAGSSQGVFPSLLWSFRPVTVA